MQLLTAAIPTNEYISGRHALRFCEPWIVPEAIKYLETLVNPEWQVFEWGCGGSVIWFAERCERVTAVESVPRWVCWGNERLLERNLSNTLIIHAPTWQGKLTGYINVIEAYKNETFDLISVDGIMSARQSSIEHVKRKLKPDGVIMIDNSNKFTVTGLEGWQELRFQTEPFKYLGKNEVWTTSFYTRKTEE